MGQNQIVLVDVIVNIKQLPITLLGINVYPQPVEDIVSEIHRLIERYKKDLRPRYISTINLALIVETLSLFSTEPRYMSALKAIRNSSFSTIDGFPFETLSRLLGHQSIQQVSSPDLFLKLVQSLSEKGKPIFLLGGDEKTLRLCMIYLESILPKIRIVGVSHAKISVEGKELLNFEDHDNLIIEQINKSAPEVLFLNLGDPKQELWFQRVKDKIHVPLTIGLRNGFDIIAGSKKRASNPVEKWVFGDIQEIYHQPKHNFFESSIRLLKFIVIATPLVMAHNFNKLLVNIFYRSKSLHHDVRNPLLYISTHHNLAIVPMPSLIDAKASLEIYSMMEDLFSKDAIVLDFNYTIHLDLEGYALILNFLKRASKEHKNLFFLNVNSDLRILFKLHRLWDFASLHLSANPDEILGRLSFDQDASSFYHSIQQFRHWVILSFFGKLDHQVNYLDYLKKIGPMIHKKECVIDLSYVTYIDNSGVGFLLKLRALIPNQIGSLKICGIRKSLKIQLQRQNVCDLFEKYNSLDEILSKGEASYS